MTSPDREVLVRPYTQGDAAPLLELLRQVWPHKHDVEGHIRDRWWWQHSEPPLYVAEDPAARRLVGLCAFIPFILSTRGGEVSGAWFVDFFVLPDCQGRGLGRRLTRAVQDRFPLTASLSQTEMAYRVFRKLGWQDRTPVTVFMHPLPRPWMFAKRRRGYRVEVARLDGAGGLAPDLDALWYRVRDSYPAIALRTGSAVLARYATHGRRSYALCCCYTDQTCIGYMVVRVVRSLSGLAGPPEGLIVDYLVRPGDAAAFDSLLSEAAGFLSDEGVSRISCMSTGADCQRVLRSRGFLSPATPLLGRRLRGNTRWLTFTTAAGNPAIDAGSWHLTMGDCDIDYAWFRD